MQEVTPPSVEAETWPADSVEVLRRLYPALMASARRLAPQESDAEDLVHEALIRTMTKHPDLARLSHPLGYTRTALWRLAYSSRKDRRHEVSPEVLIEMESDETNHDDAAALQEGLHALGPQQRACITLRYLHGLDDALIAEVLAIRPSTVRSQIARGLSSMRHTMEAHDEPNR